MNAAAIGLSALSAAQRALDVAGQNIANASTPAYHRQEVLLGDRVFDGVNGVGVDIQRIARYEDPQIRRGILSASSDAGLAGARIGVEQQVESSLTSPDLNRQLATFFDQVTRLSTRPDDMALRRSIVNTAATLAGSLNQIANDFTTLRTDTGRQIKQTVDEINQNAAKIAALNLQIARVKLSGGDPNDLLNQRDQLVQTLSEQVDVRIIPQDNGLITIIAANSPLVIGTDSVPFSATTNPAGDFVITGSDPNVLLTPTGGKLAGLLQEHNQFLPDYLSRLDEFTVAIMKNVDQIQATGLGLTGSFSNLLGTRPVINVAVPLNSAGLAIPPQAGALNISVTDTATGLRTLTAVAIDPATQSLQDVATAITAATAGQVQATVDLPSGTLQLQASAGFVFDFAGRLPSVPDSVVMNGTSVPQVTGTYTGSGNDVYSFQVVGSGTIGVTPGLTMEVRNGAGTLIGTLNVGQGYTPDTLLTVNNGISVKLSAGTTNNGSFSARMISQPDTANLLPSLGINALFQGVTAGTIAVRPAILANPALLAASRSGATGDALNLERLVNLRDTPLLNGGTETIPQYLSSSLSAVGTELNNLRIQHDSAQGLRSSLETQEQSLTGVDINEEMVKLLEFQRMIEAASRYLGISNHALDALIENVK